MKEVCQVCGGKGWIDGDPARATIERCDFCFRYPTDSDARQAHKRYKVLDAFAVSARPVLRQFLPVNSCVAATRVTVGCLRWFDIEAIPRSVKWVVEFHAARKAYVSGLTEEERSTAQDQVHYQWKDTVDPWNGHLVALTSDFLVDPSFEQAMIATEHKAESRIAIFPVEGDPRAVGKLIEYGAVSDEGERMTITYITMEDGTGWNSSEAWTDPGLRLIEDMIINSMKRLL